MGGSSKKQTVGYALEATVAFVPTAVLAADVTDDPAERELAVSDWTGLEEVVIGTLAAVGTELVRIDGVSATSLTVGRGCLDTVPEAHPAGTPVICWQPFGDATEPRFAAGETVAAKLLPETGFGTLPLAQAPTDQVTMASRAIRPLPPGNLRANGVSVADPTALNEGPVALTWAHRDRLAQTSAVFDDYTAGNIGPEPGVGYWVEIRWVDPATGTAVEPLVAELDAATATAFTLTEEDVPVLSAPFGTEQIEVRVQARRAVGAVVYDARDARRVRFFLDIEVREVVEAHPHAITGRAAAGVSLLLAQPYTLTGRAPAGRSLTTARPHAITGRAGAGTSLTTARPYLILQGDL